MWVTGKQPPCSCAVSSACLRNELVLGMTHEATLRQCRCDGLVKTFPILPCLQLLLRIRLICRSSASVLALMQAMNSYVLLLAAVMLLT